MVIAMNPMARPEVVVVQIVFWEQLQKMLGVEMDRVVSVRCFEPKELLVILEFFVDNFVQPIPVVVLLDLVTQDVDSPMAVVELAPIQMGVLPQE